MTATDSRARLLFPSTVATARTVLSVVTMAALVVTAFFRGYAWFFAPRPFTDQVAARMAFPCALAGLVGLAVAATLTALIVVVMSRPRPGVLLAADHPQLAGAYDRVEQIAARYGLVGRYRLATAPLDGRRAAHVRPERRGHPLIVLSGGLLNTHAADPRAFDAVVAHELAHVKNRDVLPTTITIAAWRATLLLAVPLEIYYLWLGQDWGENTSVLASVVLVLVARTMVLRSREFWADIQAHAAGYGEHIREALRAAPPPVFSWRRLVPLHPARRARLRALRGDHFARYAVPAEGALLAGIAVGLALPQIALWVINLGDGLLGSSMAAAYASQILPALPLAPFVWATIGLATVGATRATVGQSTALLVVFALGAAGTNALVNALGDGRTALLWLRVPTAQSATAGFLLLAVVFLGTGLIAIGWSLGVVAIRAGDTPSVSRRATSVLCGLGALVTIAVLYCVETVFLYLQGTDSPWADAEARTQIDAAAGTSAPWNVPYWARELDTGAVFTILADYTTVVTALLMLVVPLVVWVARPPALRRRWLLLAWSAFLVAAEAVNTGLIALILRAQGSAGPPSAQLLRNSTEVAFFTELLAGGVAALLVAVVARRGPIVLGACTGGLIVVLLTVSHQLVGTPVRCALSSAGAPGCAGSALSVWNWLLIAAVSAAPSLLFCTATAVAGRTLVVLGRTWRRRQPRLPTSTTGPRRSLGVQA